VHPAPAVAAVLCPPVLLDIGRMLLPVAPLVIRIPDPPLLIAIAAYQAVFGIGMVFAAVAIDLPALLALRSRADTLIGMKDGGKKLFAAVRAAAGLCCHCRLLVRNRISDSQPRKP